MKKKKKAILISSTIAAALSIGALFLMPAPVMFRYKDRAAIDPADGLTVIFNPIRNRQPERAATAILHLLKEGKCEQVVADMPNDRSYKDYICAKEQEHTLADWQLVDRTDDTEGSLLHYIAYRTDYPPRLYGNIWIGVANDGNGWRLTKYEAWYETAVCAPAGGPAFGFLRPARRDRLSGFVQTRRYLFRRQSNEEYINGPCVNLVDAFGIHPRQGQTVPPTGKGGTTGAGG